MHHHQGVRPGGTPEPHCRQNREAARPDGTKILQRMVWKNITATELDWSWEASLDGGKTWQVNWAIHYSRRR